MSVLRVVHLYLAVMLNVGSTAQPVEYLQNITLNV